MAKPSKLDSLQEAFLSLVRLGIGQSVEYLPEKVDWESVETLATEQELLAVMADGIEQLPVEERPPKKALLQCIGLVMQDETRYAVQQKAASEMTLLFHENGIRTYVLKGEVVAECYPKPEHRVSSDMDCFLVDDGSPLMTDGIKEDVWERGNLVIEKAGYEVGRGFYKNSSFYFPGLMVENHQYMVPFRGNKTLKRLEKLLQEMLLSDKGNDRFEGTWLYRPPVMVSALFLVEHAYSHFLHEGLTWRMVLDWMMFSRKHKDEIDWNAFDSSIDEFGFRRFYDSYLRLGQYLLGNISKDSLLQADKMMLVDIWAPLDLHETLHGVKAKFQLAGNYWRARWKYKCFTDITWIRALLEWGLGAVFDKHPDLN